MKITLVLIMAGLQLAAAQPAATALDTAQVHSIYLDGDFDKATALLEKAMRDKQVMSHADSIFAFKHLGVMYAAKHDTREKGKYFMYQLLNAEPTARILDMYASDMIYMIFKNIREEFEANKLKLARAEQNVVGNTGSAPAPAQAPVAAPQPVQVSKPKPRDPRRTYYLAGGAVAALVGVGITAHLLFGEDPAPAKNSYVVVE